MNINVSPINLTRAGSPSFGMAKFTEQGLNLAKSCSDTCEFLETPTEFQDAAFFQKKKILRKPPFVKYIEKALPSRRKADSESVSKVAATIVECGATRNAFSNARFVKQLLAAQSHIKALDEDARTSISSAVETVFEANWNNPELSKDETMQLLELSKDAIDDMRYVTLAGVIEKSNSRTPKA